MKVVVIGNGKIGSSLSSALVSEGHDVTIVDNNEAKLNRSKNTLDVMCIEGNGATSETQLEASVDKSQIVISVTPYDELNILSCLIAKRLGAEKTILRVRMPEYFKQMHLIKEELGLSMVINPELITASEIFRVLTLPAAVKVEVFGKGRLELIEFKVTDKTGIAPINLQNLYKKVKTKFLVCAVQRDKEVLIPTGDFIIRNNDRLSIAATHKSIEKFFRSSGLMKDKVKSVMIAGGGMIGYYLASQLLAVGMRVKIIEKDEDRSLEIARLLPKAIVICGDGTDQALLLEEGIMSVDAFVALTGIDEENIIPFAFCKGKYKCKSSYKNKQR